MHFVRATAISVLAACLLGAGPACGFEGTGTSIGSDRDHDGDGVDDERDGCPHVADPSQADADGDGIGDACDPSDDVRHRRVLFEGFYEALAEGQWEVAGYGTLADWAVVVEGGKGYLRQSSGQSGRRQLRWRQVVSSAEVVTEAAVDSVKLEGTRGVGVLLADRSTLSSGSYGVCAVQRPSGSSAEKVVAGFYLADTAVTTSDASWNQGLEGATMIRGWHSQAGVDGRVDCELRRGTHRTSLSVARPETSASGLVGLHTEGVAASFDYLFVIAPR